MTCAKTLLADETGLLTRSSPSARADAQLLLAYVLRRPREWLAAHGEAAVCAEDVHAFRKLCERRAAGVPVAYLLENAWFYGREFAVNENVLVPRPETEHLVEDALGFINGPLRVLDVGTGGGAIACTIAAETHACVDATDASRAAIELATENARRLDVSERCRFYHGDLSEPVREHRYDVVIANLPYVPTKDLPKPPDPASFEPRDALDGGPDGLATYRKLLAQLPPLLKQNALVLLEAAPPTINALAEALRTSLPNFAVSVHSDYAGLARYVKAVARTEKRRSADEASESAGARTARGRRIERRLAQDARAQRPTPRNASSKEALQAAAR